ncbi:MAG: NADH-quinone oxidoreductase subunit NuoG [Pseudomonadales bacterium]|jgi:NADH-quinone oxidoreductase subunit G|nr:NADH-quinone oxidoreductase subunit NuoG [Pseudomonadales bacterium]
MPTIDVDGKRYEVRDGTNVLHACLSHGLNLPYFCWHPALGSVGACRQCAVIQYRDADDTQGRLTMACMTPVADGARFSIEAPHASEFRASVIEWLMLNHPHDCPVCEEGGECHLQDMTEMSGHTSRRYRGRKRTFENQYLGPFINHEMNRCITCYRCTRFYEEHAGGTDLQAFGSRDRVYFGRFEPGPLESEFAGNLVEVCPTGVFTDRTLSASYTRKWDLQSAPSICAGCGVGCNTLPGERYGKLKRVHNRYHSEVNGYFLCDRGRFGAGYVNGDARLRHAGRRAGDETFDALPVDDAVAALAALLAGTELVGIGSPRSSLEDNFMLRQLVGAQAFSTGLPATHARTTATALALLAQGTVPAATLTELEAADAVLILGEDLSNTAPRTALAVRQASRTRTFELAASVQVPHWQDAGVRRHAQEQRSPVLRVTPAATRLDDICAATLDRPPASIARIGSAIAHALDPGRPAPGTLDEEEQAFVRAAAAALMEAERPVIVSGEGCQRDDVLRAAASVAEALAPRTEARLLFALERCNSAGVGLLGGGLGLAEALARAAAGATLIVLGNDLFRQAPPEAVRAALAGAASVVAIDEVETATVAAAQLVLPMASSVEATGTFVNSEGRAQRFFEVFEPEAPIRPAWRWFSDAARAAGRNDLVVAHHDALLEALEEAVPALSGVVAAAPGAGHRAAAGLKIPRQPHRYSGRTAMYADRTLHEPKTPEDPESPFSFSMEGASDDAPGALLAGVWAPGWNSNNALTRFQEEVAGHLRGGPAGVRLLRASGTAADGAGDDTPSASPPSASVDDGLLLVPLHDVFSSDELAARTDAIRDRAAPLRLGLHPDDAQALGLNEGMTVACEGAFAPFHLGLRLDARQARGTLTYVHGAPGMPPPGAGRATLRPVGAATPPPGGGYTVLARG